MALNDRQRTRVRGALEAVMRAEDAVAAVADELAHGSQTGADAALDEAAGLLKRVVALLEPLGGGRGA